MLSSKEQDLIKDFIDMLDNTHGYDSEIYQEMKEKLKNKETEDFSLYEIKQCIDYLDNTHCYETQIYEDLIEYKNEKGGSYESIF